MMPVSWRALIYHLRMPSLSLFTTVGSTHLIRMSTPSFLVRRVLYRVFSAQLTLTDMEPRWRESPHTRRLRTGWLAGTCTQMHGSSLCDSLNPLPTLGETPNEV